MVPLSTSQVGDNVLVEVESVFNGGMIVAYKSPEGYEYRGALLLSSPCNTCRQCQPVLTKSASCLANPLTFLHDHPYSDLENYAKQISTKMPSNIFLQWNSVPVSNTPPSTSSPHKLHSRTLNGKVEERSSPATVVASVTQPSDAYTWPYILKPVDQRSAKCLARLKLKEKLEMEHTNPRNSQQKGKVVSRAKKPKSQKRSSLGVGRARIKRSPDTVKDELQWFDDINYARRRHRSLPPLFPTTKLTLKELTIPIQKVAVRVRKKQAQCHGNDARSSSVSSSTLDSSPEPTSRLSASPLNNLHSKDYNIIIH